MINDFMSSFKKYSGKERERQRKIKETEEKVCLFTEM